MLYHLEVDSENKAEERFLHVLQGADAGAQALPTALVTVADGTYEGAIVGTTLALFPVHTDVPVNALTYEVSGALTTHIITGLMPNTSYNVTLKLVDSGIAVMLVTGDGMMSDGAGVLLVDTIP